MDQLGELKLGDCWVQRTESTDAQRISADRAEAMLQILGELHLNMCSNIERQGARVNLGRQIQGAGHRATERTGTTGDATRHARGEWHHAATEAEGPQQQS